MPGLQRRAGLLSGAVQVLLISLGIAVIAAAEGWAHTMVH
jgi:hypothetical protein